MPTPRNNKLEHLHPDFRRRVSAVLSALRKDNVPLRLFEGARHPYRQAELYARGRFGDDRKTVTRAKPWSSFHQYGFAADFVAWDGRRWFWPKASDSVWKILHELGMRSGLRALSFEKPHLQMDGLTLEDLRQCRFGNGDDDWERWIYDAAAVGAPPPSVVVDPAAWDWPPDWLTQDRPELEDNDGQA